jgi:hypothetical protein
LLSSSCASIHLLTSRNHIFLKHCHPERSRFSGVAVDLQPN